MQRRQGERKGGCNQQRHRFSCLPSLPPPNPWLGRQASPQDGNTAPLNEVSHLTTQEEGAERQDEIPDDPAPLGTEPIERAVEAVPLGR